MEIRTEELKAKLDAATAETHALREAFDQYKALTLHDRARVDKVVHQASKQRTWLLAGIVVAVLVAVLLATTNRVTLQQAQADLSEQVLTCFLRPGQVTPAVARACDERFSPDGHEYLKLQQRSARATDNFGSLQEWAKSKGWAPPTTTTLKQ